MFAYHANTAIQQMKHLKEVMASDIKESGGELLYCVVYCMLCFMEMCTGLDFGASVSFLPLYRLLKQV